MLNVVKTIVDSSICGGRPSDVVAYKNERTLQVGVPLAAVFTYHMCSINKCMNIPI